MPLNKSNDYTVTSIHGYIYNVKRNTIPLCMTSIVRGLRKSGRACDASNGNINAPDGLANASPRDFCAASPKSPDLNSVEHVWEAMGAASGRVPSADSLSSKRLCICANGCVVMKGKKWHRCRDVRRMFY